MATLTDTLYDLSGTVPWVGAQVEAFLATSQPALLTNLDGSARPPIGTHVAATTTTQLGEYQLTGLADGVLYDLYVTPAHGRAFWIPDRVADLTASVSPCVLHGTVDVATDLVWAFLEFPAVVSGGIHIANGLVFCPVSSNGTFALALWPTSSLLPGSLYRVHLGSSIYRGSVPLLTALSLADWLALATTKQIA